MSALAAAQQLFADGKVEPALDAVRRVLRRTPADADAHDAIGTMLFRLGRMAQAEFHLARAAQARPDNPVFRNNHANVLCATGRGAAAAAEYRAALARTPAYFPSLVGLARALAITPDFGGAAAAAQQAEIVRPDLPDPYELGAIALTQAGRIDEALAVLARGLERLPEHPRLLTARVGATSYRDDLTPEIMREACVRAGTSWGADERPARAADGREGRRPIRVGVLSGDLREHAVARFWLPIAEHLDPARVAIHYYSTSPAVDPTTDRLRARAAGWTDASLLPSADLLARLRADRLDVLLDLSGYSTGHRQSVLARGAAPVQATYLGWPTSTGVRAMDWRIVDSITDPPGAEAHGTERLLRLDPCFLCYEPPTDAPALPPSVRPGSPPTFGSFNALPKLNRRTLALWARALRAAPEARLVLKAQGFADADARARTLATLVELGVEASRVDVLGPTAGIRAHLEAYSRVTVALDPTPYNGTTTTCEALWMGVPVVTRRGGMHLARVGESVLRAAGFGEWVADDDDAFVAKAVSLLRVGGGGAGGAWPREEVRRQVAASSLTDARAMGARFADALERMEQAS
ncbi:MAG: hypothetical protein JNM80_03595 [Phycisphaerae bacterium]|nr:hypothetical protein [Phycisphaerae bacterium]